MSKVGALFESLILLAIGVYIGLLVLFGDYWRFLNPKFTWLTGVTAVVLIGASIVALLHPARRFHLSRILIFLLFLRLLTMGMSGSVSFVKGFQAGFSGKSRVEFSPTILVNGQTYIRINLGELYFISQHKDPADLGKSYVVRGIVKRSAALDDAGQFALVRTAVFCCLADAVSMGFRVNEMTKASSEEAAADQLADGRWVEIYGKLKPFEHKPPAAGLQIQGLFLPLLSSSYRFVPDGITPIDAPEIPYMFQFHNQEPYAY